MFVCKECLKPEDKHSVRDSFHGRCERCGKTANCYEVYLDCDVEKVLPPVKREFGIVNLVVEASPEGVKIWACDPKEGCSVFRLKCRGGKITYNPKAQDFHDVIIEGGGKQ